MERDDRIARLRFDGEWRRYQTLALDAFDRDVAGGAKRTHVVAPPGSGKTLMGVEMVRRLGVPALVLAPNTAVQGQWLRTVGAFAGGAGLAAADPDGPVACLTYQSLCRLDDPAAVLGDLAVRRWAAQRAETVAATADEILAEAAGWTGEAARRRDAEQADVTATIKREIARAEHGALSIGDLLPATVRTRIAALKSAGVGTVVLDECHHLASLWGYVVRAVVEELGDCHLVGLTATPPDGLTRDEAELYDALLGPVDFTVPTPAVVREGYLAPYQELAWLTEPLESESAWLAERDQRFRELVTALHADPDGAASFPAWVVGRMRSRTRDGEEGAEVSWAAFARHAPDLASAGARFLASAGLALPEGAPRGEEYRARPSLDDWLVLLEDYALRCLGALPDSAGAARYEAIAAALRELGFVLTRQGIRRGASQVDRLLTASAAKSLALAEVVSAELDSRTDGLRALVLVDAEQAQAAPDAELVGVLRPAAGTAAEAVLALSGDSRTAVCRPLLVSGRGVRCAPDDVVRVTRALQQLSGAAGLTFSATPEITGLVRIDAAGGEWTPARWVGLATEVFTSGAVRVVVGTRGMLGEGWDAPCVNVVVDMSAATTSVSVTQMRGRSLRLDPENPSKIASNWDIVCVAPDLVRGEADYERFVRKHRHVFAPCEDGVIEAGPSHVHPELGPFGPPPAVHFDDINRHAVARAADHAAARARWKIGEPYEGAELDTVVVRRRRPGKPRAARPLDAPPDRSIGLRGPATMAGTSLAAAVYLALFFTPAAPIPLAALPLAAGWAWWRQIRAAARLEEALPVDFVAAAIRDAYVELGEISSEAGRSLAIEPRASGYLRIWLRSGTSEEGALFAAALDDLLDPAKPPRYLVSRPVGTRGALRRFVRALGGMRWAATRWVPVPADLGRKKERAEVFARAAARWLGRGKLLFTERSAAGRQALAEVLAGGSDLEAVRRHVWR